MARTKPDLSTLWAESGTTTDPGTSKVETGWIQEVPTFQVFNWILNRQDQLVAHVNDWGIASWDAVTEYPLNAWSRGSDGEVYVSIQATNTNHDPTSAALWWQDLYSFISVASHTHVELPTSDQKDALDGAASPDSGNVFATMADITAAVPLVADSSIPPVTHFGELYQVGSAAKGYTTSWTKFSEVDQAGLARGATLNTGSQTITIVRTGYYEIYFKADITNTPSNLNTGTFCHIGVGIDADSPTVTLIHAAAAAYNGYYTSQSSPSLSVSKIKYLTAGQVITPYYTYSGGSRACTWDYGVFSVKEIY